MSVKESDPERERVSASDLSEGDTVFMGIYLHGTSDDHPGVEYDRELYQAGVEGTVVKPLSDMECEVLDDPEVGRPMADLTVETDDGVRYTWNVDNGYVIGPVDHPDRPDRSDVGKIGGLYQ